MPKAIKKRKKAVKKIIRKKTSKKPTRKTAKKTNVKRKKPAKNSLRKKTSKKSASKTVKKAKSKKSTKTSKKPIWTDHVEKMQNKIDAALKKLEKDIKRKASYKIIEEDNNELLMLLGECNYIVREFHEQIVK